MLQLYWNHRFSMSVRFLVLLMVSAFLTVGVLPVTSYAQMMRHTPSTSVMLVPATRFTPMNIEGIRVFADNPLRFEFIAGKGSSGLNGKALEEQSALLVKYFLAALTIPERDMWVNLSPYEKDVIIEDNFMRTHMGKVLLEQDYVLKQMTASLTYPESNLGRQFWGRVYQKAYEKFGTTDIPINAFNKVWIVPKSADVVDLGQGAVIIDSQLDVMVESDYLAIKHNISSSADGNQQEENELYSGIIREIIIPELRREVNEGKYFAALRQVYHAMILATWYKRHLKQGVLGRIYIRQNKIDGVANDDPQIKQKVYEQYLETFRKGIYNYIREDFDQTTHKVVPRKYISGGMEFTLLGLGGEGDKYRELSPTAINALKPMSDPLLVSADLTLLTRDGEFVSLPGKTDMDKKEDLGFEDPSGVPPGLLRRWVKRIFSSMIFVTVLGVGALYPSQAHGAGFTQNSKGDLVVQIQQGDTFGDIVQRMRSSYRTADPQTYRTSGLSGNLWGPQGVVRRLSGGRNVENIQPNSEFIFEKGLLPERVIAQLVPARSVPADVPILSVPAVEPQERGIDSVPVGPSAQERGQVRSPELTDPGIKNSPIDLLLVLGGLTLWFGIRKALSSRAKNKFNKEKKKSDPVAASPQASAEEGIRFITQDDESPRLDDEEVSVSETFVDREIFVAEEGPVASEQEEALWRQELTASPARASVETFPSLRMMDVLGTTAGVFLTGAVTDWNLQAMGASALIMPFLTRITFALQLYTHEVMGHLLPALAISEQRSKVFTASNLKANYELKDWARLLTPGLKPSPGKNPQVETWTQGVRKKIIDVSGFAVTFFAGLLAGWESFHLWLPFVGPVAIASWKVLTGSYSTDIRGRDMAEGAVADVCGASQCGIFGALWSDDSKEIYPQWLRDGFTKLINALIIRGGQSAGEFAIGFRSSARKGADVDMVPILSKVLKYKRGQGLTETLDEEFSRTVDRVGKQKVSAVSGVKGVLGHVRFATGGKVTREASHPHMGVEEEHNIWVLENGQWVYKTINVFAAIGHNGDNDGWKMWGHEFNTSQIREIFPAIFRMPRTYKVVLKQKDPVTGREVRQTKYEALPPGDSPPLALQLHFLLTQGDWVSSARFAFIDHLLGRTTEGSEKVNAQQLLNDALGRLPDMRQEEILAEAFEAVFKRHAPFLLRPRLNKADKSFVDLWVTEDVVKRFESLRYQLSAINAFRQDLQLTFLEALKSESDLGRVLKQAGPVDEERIRGFVDLAVEMFFTGSRSAAVEQFARRSTGSYGLAVRTSKEPNGVTLYSADQGVTIGYNQAARLVTFSSEHSTLQYAFGEKGKMDHLVFINPEQPGQMADVNLKPDVSQGSPITIKVYSFALNRTMTADEIAQQQFPQDADNPYWSPQISYADPNEIVMTDINTIPKEVRAARQSWEDAQSFNRQTAEALIEKLTARHIEQFIKETSEFYGTIQANLMVRIFARARDCLSQGGCDVREASRRSAQISDRLQADGRISDFVRSRLDWVVGQVSQELAAQVVAGKSDETDISVWVRQNVDAKLKELLDKEIDDVVNAVLGGDLQNMTAFQQWDAAKEISGDAANAGLDVLARSTAGLLKEQKESSEPNHAGHSLVAGETDMIITGYEDSLWLGENFVEMMKTVFPKMKIWATSSNKVFNLNGDHIVGRSTIGMIISKSGATYPSRGIVRRLKQISQGNVFAMTARVDNLIAMSLGQKFKPDSPFTKRIFVTGNYYPAEANSVGEVMLFAHQIELMIYLSERMLQLFPDQRPWGLTLTGKDLAELKGLRDRMYEEASRLTGYDQAGQMMDGQKIRQHIAERIRQGYMDGILARRLAEHRQQSSGVRPTEIVQILKDVLLYDGPGADPAIQSILGNLLTSLESDPNPQRKAVIFQKIINPAGQIDQQGFRQFLIELLQNADAEQLKMMEGVYLSPNRSIVDNGHALGKTMTESMIVNNIVFRLFVMSIFWFGAPLENLLSLAGIHFGGTLQDGWAFLVRSLDGVMALCAPWLMTTLIYRLWSGRPQWARLGPPTVVLGDPIPALHQTGENYWSKLGAVSLGSMSMDIHGANPDDHFVARLAHRVVRGTIAVFGVPAEHVSKENVIVSMRQTKAIINGMFLNFFKGGAEVFSVGRGELNNPDVTDHHMDIGAQNLQGASPAVQKFNGLTFDAFGRNIAYKVLFANAYHWATRWEPRITLLGKTVSLKKFYLWNPAWTYSRTGVHTTRSPKGGPTVELPDYLDPSDGATREISKQLVQEGREIVPIQGNGADQSVQKPVSSSTAQTLNVTDVSSQGSETRRGGIDMNTKWLDLKITESGRADLLLDGKSLDLISIKGIMPRITDIQPISMNRVYVMWGRSGLVMLHDFSKQESTTASISLNETLAVLREEDFEDLSSSAG